VRLIVSGARDLFSGEMMLLSPRCVQAVERPSAPCWVKCAVVDRSGTEDSEKNAWAKWRLEAGKLVEPVEVEPWS
jgi:hypothetical protein